MKLTLLSLFVLSQFAMADVISYTSFEEGAVYPSTYYTDTGDPATDHALINNSGEPLVNFTSTGGEIGFTSFYTNTRGGVGLTDGDYVGIQDYTGDVTVYPDGTQGFNQSDCDGLMTTTFDEVDLSGFENQSVSLQYFVKATGYEADDRIRIWLIVNGGTEIDLLNTEGSDIDDLGIEGSWLTLNTDLAGYTTATLEVEFDCNSADESLYIDDISFEGTPAASIDRKPGTGSITKFQLYANYPNPFNPSTTLKFDVPENTENLELIVFDMLGKKVKTLHSGNINRGQFSATWNGTNESGNPMPSGVYFAVLNTKNFSQSVKMMLIK